MTLDYASRVATDWLAAETPEPWRELEGTAVLADLTGFTRLTERLTSLGAEGAEVLHRALTLCFSTLLGASMTLGGDIIGFAGDAALVWFDGDDHEIRAIESACAMSTSLGRLPAAVTGGKRLRASVGVHTGTMTAMLVGSPQRALFLCGPEISTLVTLEAAAGPGQVVASASLADRLPPSWRGPDIGPGVLVTRRGRPRAAAVTPFATRIVHADDADPTHTERMLSLLSPAVRELMTTDIPMGDHRAAAIGFVAVPGIDTMLMADGPDAVHRALDLVATTVGRIAGELSVAWLDTDVGVNSVKLMLTAGSPQAVDDDEGRLLLALRRILDESDVALRAGAQRGRVFSGALGVSGRRTFTVLGDPVNVAARALGFAADRELIAGDGLGVADRPSVTAVGLGAKTLKNRVRPVEMWRVTAVHAPAEFVGGSRSTPMSSGRVAERERIAAAWKRTFEGVGASLSIVGDPGMGASDLLAEAADRAGPAATLVVADPYRTQIPYGTVTTIVRSLALAAGAGDADQGWPWLASFGTQPAANDDHPVDHPVDHIAEWLDDGRRALQQQPRDEEVDPATTARRARAVLVALIEAAAPNSWLLAIDDLDAVDDASRLVLSELRAMTHRHEWLLLTSSSLSGISLAADADPSTVITLDPFEDGEATQFVIEIEPRLRDDQVARIVAAGKGNPFVLSELARHPQGGELPDSLDRLGAARVDALPVATRRLVRDVATFGTTISLATIADVLGRDDLADPDAWTDAASVLRPAGPGLIAFRHDAYRIAAHTSLPFQRRRELHGLIADHLARQPGHSHAVLARHYEEAGRTREAFPLAVNAGRAAACAGALVEASDLIGMAVRLARDVDRPALGSLLVEQGRILTMLGDFPGAERALSAAGRALRDPVGYSEMCSERASLAIRRSQYRQARSWSRKGLSVTDPLACDAVEIRCKLLLDDAAALYFTGRYAQSLRLAAQALSAAELAGNDLLQGRAHLHLEMAHSVLPNSGARKHADEAIRIFESIGHDRLLGAALVNSGLSAMHAGDWDDALLRYRRAAIVIARTGDVADAAIVLLNEGFLLLRQGRTAQADALGIRAMRAFDNIEMEIHGAYARHLRSRIAAVERRFDVAEELMAASRAAFARLGDRAMVIDCDVASIDRLLREGRPPEALAFARSIESAISGAEGGIDDSYALLRGIAEARTDDAAHGVARVLDALRSARERHLKYDEYLCLTALIEIEQAGGPAAPPNARFERDAITAALGLVLEPLPHLP